MIPKREGGLMEREGRLDVFVRQDQLDISFCRSENVENKKERRIEVGERRRGAVARVE
jgi:hypothetical protein